MHSCMQPQILIGWSTTLAFLWTNWQKWTNSLAAKIWNRYILSK